MKQLLFTFILLFVSWSSFSQEEFSFTLYFEDAVGNRDSLILGYDEDGTQFLDEQFGEVDISNEPWDSVFEVRASERTYNSSDLSSDGLTPQYFTKKQIVSKPLCPSSCWILSNNSSLSISLKATHYPVHVSWSTNMFESDTCVKGSRIDYLNASEFIGYELKNLVANFTEFSPFHLYQNEDNDTINIFWVIFCSDQPVIINSWDKTSNNIQIYPNPVDENLHVELENKNKVTQVEVVDVFGKVHLTISSNDFKNQEYLDVSFLNSGRYVLKIYSQLDIQVKQFIKL